MNHPQPLEFLAQIVSHVPMWVWIVLTLLIVMGIKQSRTQAMTRKRLMILPLVWLVFGAWGVEKGFGQAGSAGVAMLAWAAGLLTGTGALLATRWPGQATYQAGTGRFLVPGSWLPMAVMLAIFCARFAVGMALGLQPTLASQTWFAALASLSFGLLSGFFVGRSLNILRRGPGFLSPAATMTA